MMAQPTRQLLNELETIRKNFEKHFGSLSGEALNRKPDASTWSVGQNMDHLIRVNSSYLPVFEQLLAGVHRPPLIGRLPFLPAWIGKLILQSVEPRSRRKTKTFDIWEPAASQIPADIVSRFSAHQLELQSYLERSDELWNRGLVISSPANRHIAYPIETAWEVIVAHEQRHFDQAREADAFFKAQS